MSLEGSGGSGLQAGSPVDAAVAMSQGAGAVKDAPSPEAPVEAEAPKVEEKVEDPKFATRFAALTKREKQLMERESRLKAEENQFKAWKEATKNAKLNPSALLESHGLTLNELADHLISSGQKKELTPDEKIAALEKKLDDDRKAREDEKKALGDKEIEDTIAQVKSAISEIVSGEPDKYELIHANEAHDVVYQVVEEHWMATRDPETGKGQILPMQKACDMVEEWLESQAREKILKLKKFAPKEVETVAEVKEDGTKTTIPTTLTNRVATQVTSSTPTDLLSDEESKRRAAAMLRWK